MGESRFDREYLSTCGRRKLYETLPIRQVREKRVNQEFASWVVFKWILYSIEYLSMTSINIREKPPHMTNVSE